MYWAFSPNKIIKSLSEDLMPRIWNGIHCLFSAISSFVLLSTLYFPDFLH